MSRDRTTTDDFHGQTWRSSHASPAVPDPDEVRALVDAVGVDWTDDWTLARVELGPDANPTNVHEWLPTEDALVGTSRDHDAGPDDPATFDVVVEPGYGPAPVGRAVSTVDDVVGVTVATATALTGSGGRPGTAGPTVGDGRSGAANDADSDEFRTDVDRGPSGTLPGELDGQGLGDDDESDASGLVGADEVGGTESEGAPADDSGGDDADGVDGSERRPQPTSTDRLDALDARLAELEAAVGEPDGGFGGGEFDEDVGAAVDRLEERIARLERAVLADDEGLAERVDRLESRVEEHDDWQRRFADALVGNWE